MDTPITPQQPQQQPFEQPSTQVSPVVPQEPTPHAAPSMQTPSAPKKKRHWLGMVATVLALLVLGTGGVFAFIWYEETYTQQGDVFARMEAAWAEVDTFRYAFTVNADGYTRGTSTYPGFDGSTQTSTDEASFAFSVMGDYVVDATNEENPLSQGDTEVEFDIDGKPMSITDEVALSHVFDGEELYLRITRMPTIAALLGLGALEDVWLKMTLEDVESVSGGEISVPTLTVEDEVEIAAYVAEYPPFTFEQDSTEMIGSVETIKYTLTLNEDNFSKVLQRVVDTTQEGANVPEVALSAEEITQISACIFDVMSFDDIAVWIGKKDDLPYKAVFEMSFRGSEAQLEGCMPQEDLSSEFDAEYTSDTFVDMSITIEVLMSDFNTPIVITTPADARPLEEIMAEVFGSMGGGMVEMGTSSSPSAPFVAVPDEAVIAEIAAAIESALPAVEDCFARGAKPESIFVGARVCEDGYDGVVWPEAMSGSVFVYGNWERTTEDVSDEWVIVADFFGNTSLLCTLKDGCVSTSTAVTDAKYWDL